jgi:hypothetical protein
LDATEDIKDFNAIYRFINVYGIINGDHDIIVAGYDALVTTAHPAKKQGGLDGAQKNREQRQKRLLINPSDGLRGRTSSECMS